MTVYYVKQDNTVWGCGDPGCCGEYYEEIDDIFYNCDCKDVQVDSDHLQGCMGGGPVLKWRKATPKETLAFTNGRDTGYSEGHWDGAEYQKRNDAIKAEYADKAKTEPQRSIHELVHLGYRVTVDGSKIGKSINHYTEYDKDTILDTPAIPSEFVNTFSISIKSEDVPGNPWMASQRLYLDVGDESVEITGTMAQNIARAMDEYNKKFGVK